MNDFASATQVHIDEDGGFHADFPPEAAIWSVNGGYIAAAMVRTAGLVSPRSRPLNVTVQFLRPVRPGEVQLSVGRRAATTSVEMVEVELSQAGRLSALAHIWTADVGAGPRLLPARMPMVPHPDELRTMQETMGLHEKPLGPFWNIYEQKPIGRVAGASRRDRPANNLRWFRYLTAAPSDDAYLNACYSLPLIDVMALPAASFANGGPILDGLSPTIQLTVHFYEHGFHPWLLSDAWSEAALEGVLHGRVKVWSLEGALVAQGITQMIVPAQGAKT